MSDTRIVHIDDSKIHDPEADGEMINVWDIKGTDGTTARVFITRSVFDTIIDTNRTAPDDERNISIKTNLDALKIAHSRAMKAAGNDWFASFKAFGETLWTQINDAPDGGSIIEILFPEDW
jgi:hypothetical protein